ncbi:PEP/pyruvate-binding domain-containing protein [Candidatus Poriferisodalis sp.]|uniref:PEP/pyruvate-binding domain-containing protein n=1 Tax=Candidatus Poriferisodalis sp. TaxID=3101277 RepID=UPI003B59996F
MTDVPIQVASTADDYFVLYRLIARGNSGIVSVPISVTQGVAGTTTLNDSLRPLSADQYRVEKYSVSRPADIDGDCIDDLTELADSGAYHPLNAGKVIDAEDGRVAIDSHETFLELSYRGDWSDDLLGLTLPDLYGRSIVKFWITDLDTNQPAVYFQNTHKHQAHGSFARAVGVQNEGYGNTVMGELIWEPNVVAPDGTLGVYRYRLRQWIAHMSSFWILERYHEILASAMPFVDNNLSLYASTPIEVNLYKTNRARIDATRVSVLLDHQLHPDVDYVPLNGAQGYGRLRLMEEGERPGPRDVAIYRTLPNDLPRVAGTITTVPQTPLSHVNLRAIQNGIPNAFIRDVLDDESVVDLIGAHVYYEVAAGGYTIREVTKAEVDTHFDSLRPQGTQTLQRDLSVTSITALADVSFADWTAFGVKAANVAELNKLSLPDGTTPTGFAVPFYFYDEFMKQAAVGKKTILGKKKAPEEEKITLAAGTKLAEAVTLMLAHPYFQSDYDIQEEMLDDLRDAIKDAATPQFIIDALTAMHAEYPDGQSLRYRSSTNNEDLPSFSGAGLYSSKTQDPDETAADGIDKSIKSVWASLWNFRAFLERDFHRVDHTTAAMGVLVHPNYSDEVVNGVAVSHDPITFQDDVYYVNSQVGEDLVTNPEAYSQPEQLLLDSAGTAAVLQYSSLSASDQPLMSDAHMRQLRSNLKTVHDRFETLYGVEEGEDFAIEVEFKITSDDRLAIKQARPWIFAEPLYVAAPTVAVDILNSGVTEGASVKVAVTRRGGILPLPLSVNLRWSETGEMLANGGPTSVTIPSGQARVTFSVPTEADQEDEPHSLVTVSLVADDAYDIDSASSASTLVRDDDLGDDLCTSVLSGDGNVSGTWVSECGSEDRSGRYAWFYVFSLGGSSEVTIDLMSSADTYLYLRRGLGQKSGAALALNDDGGDGYNSRIRRSLGAGDYTIEATTFRASTAGSFTLKLDGIPTQTAVQPKPEISIVAGADIDEGSDAVFTVTADPVPVAALDVTVAVTATGDFGVSPGSRTVTIPTSGSATLTVATANDSADDVDGSVTATVSAGSDYTVSATTGAATVAVQDDDVPEISIAAGADVDEGSDATFTVSAVPAPSAGLDVEVTVSQSGDVGVLPGSYTVTVPTTGSATLTVATANDSADEADGSVTATVGSGQGYMVSATAGSATVAVADDDDAPCDTATAVSRARAAFVWHTGNNGGNEVLFWQILAYLGADPMPAPPGGTVPVSTTPETVRAFSVGKPWPGWVPINAAMQCHTPLPGPAVDPVVSVTAGGGVAEGGDAVFTVTADPAPTVPLTVNVAVAQSGDFGVATGSQSVTVPTSGSATLTVATTNDSTDEPDGSVTVTADGGSGYTVSSAAGTASVGVADDDDPPAPPAVDPAVSVTAGGNIAEGGDAAFTITADPAPSSPLTVTVTVSQSGDFGVTTGSRSVTVPASGSATLTVATTNDSTDEADGSVTVTVDGGSGYTVSATAGAASVAVADDDDPPPPPPPVVNATPSLSISDASAGEGGTLTFTVTLSPASDRYVWVHYYARPRYGAGLSATFADFAQAYGMLTFRPGETAKTVTVTAVDDSSPEGDETFKVVLYAAVQAAVADAEGIGTITDND